MLVQPGRSTGAMPTRTKPPRVGAVVQPSGGLVGQREQRLVADQCPRARVFEDVAHLGSGEPPVDRHGDGAQVVGGEERFEEFGAVVREDRHHVAGPDPPPGQAAGQRRHAVRHLPVGDRLALEEREHLVRRPSGVMRQHVAPIHVARSHRRGGHERDRAPSGNVSERIGNTAVGSLLVRAHCRRGTAARRPIDARPRRAVDRRPASVATQWHGRKPPVTLGARRTGRRATRPSSTRRPACSPEAATTRPASPSCASPTISARARCTTTSARRRTCSPPSTTG